ncbi:hyphally regulated cell wall protein 3 [Ceratitis capitata]|uniref:Regulatory protein zeste n=1 Tax=Ceratitis capitata TaxID=7213 RepID=W8BEI5_CERCA|nr:hyphally regulated cell wall protein 3 [Ceratitis capitata]XP_004519218.1 hyphally regulated cell wall protein 3 [Ceratitis capitata]XP_004519219.1 hyphally regulated cell wall protein 3 [Ceratitis capitata]XP_004519220.1 hyphally regulated cell wall protein 3 [Ceratitis capitata]XP_004519221.1 hyphally regulated cell wall protein 3 [Ceratitis capitata]XP_012162389.1 hyphally regulated cell wall protein 3 [Ceratitis capitata]XP_012162398.1 hyphally regulated cell wall protein 3 [Ceratitis 
MEKTPRYTQRERNMVLGFAAQYKDVIENKRTDAESNRKKDEVWRQIAKEFNARVYHQRSSKQLRQLYKNMKLLLKKDLCGEGKGNRTFMDLLNTLSQQESVAQYISEQMSPNGGSGIGNGGYGGGRGHKYDDDYDDSKNPFPQLAALGYDGMDPDVIVIKSEDISDNEQSQAPEDMDDDDCLSAKDIPEVCLEEEDDEIFATDLRQSTPLSSAHVSQRGSYASNGLHAQQPNVTQQQQQQPEVTIQNVGGIRVGSIGSLANLKALQNGGSNNSALSIPNSSSGAANGNNSNSNNNGLTNSNGLSAHNSGGGRHTPNSRQQQVSAEQQAAQQLLLNGLGLSAVHPQEPPLPQLHRGTHAGNNGSSNNSLINSTNQLLLSLNANAGYAGMHKSSHGHSHSHHHLHNGHAHSGGGGGGHGGSGVGALGGLHNHSNSSNGSSSGIGGAHNINSRSNDYLMSLAIKEREKKIDLLNAQIDYWKTLTKKLDANAAHNPSPACMCHFPGKVNGLQTPTSSS